MARSIIGKHLLGSLAAALVLLAAGLVIWGFRRASGTRLPDVLFCVGALPIALFAIGQLGRFSRRGDHADQLSRPHAGPHSSRRRDLQDTSDLKTIAQSGLLWMLAGLWVWLVVFLM